MQSDARGPKDLSFWPQVPTETLPWLAVRGWRSIWVPLGASACVICQLLSCPTLWDPVDVSLPGSSVHGIPQARILTWVAIPFSRGSSQPRDRTHLSYVSKTGWQVLYLPLVPPGNAPGGPYYSVINPRPMELPDNLLLLPVNWQHDCQPHPSADFWSQNAGGFLF